MRQAPTDVQLEDLLQIGVDSDTDTCIARRGTVCKWSSRGKLCSLRQASENQQKQKERERASETHL